MRNRLTWLGALGGLLALGWCVWALWAKGPASPIRHDNDIVFATSGGETLRLDLALPTQGTGPFPAVVCLHGGGWVGGDRKQMASTVDVLARRGYVAISPDYRLAPKYRFPDCIEDCKASVRWLRANAGKYRIDPRRIGVVGLSAGGHLACLLGVTGPSDGLDGTGDNASLSSAVAAVVATSAPTDLTDEAIWKPVALKRNFEPLLGGPPQTQPDAYRKASPIHYRPTNPPPFLLIHGSADPSVPLAQMRAFSAKLKAGGGSVREVILPNEGHTWGNPSLRQSVEETLLFLDEKLKP